MKVSDILKEELETLKADIITRHEQAGQVASGRTKAAFSVGLTSEWSGVSEGASYTGVLEHGSDGDNVPYDFNDILQRWVQAKGLTFSTQADFNRFAYFVMKKTQDEGTWFYQTGRPHNGNNADIYTTPIDEFTERISDKVSIFLTDDIKNSIEFLN